MKYEEKKQILKEKLRAYAKEDVLLAFSGGVDSSLLLFLCCEQAKSSGKNVYAVTLKTKMHPNGDLEIARRVAAEAGAEHLILSVDELFEAGMEENPPDRCYLCKRCLFLKLKEKAKELGVKRILEGTNEEDLHVYRPGIRALKELDIVSPLADAGFCKEEVRRLALEYGISVARRPSTPCMATRFPYGDKLSYEAMHQVACGEEYLRSLGFYNVRIRVHGKIARIEIDMEDFSKLLEQKEEIVCKLKESGYDYVTLDLEGFRSGSMDLHVTEKKGGN